MIEKLLCVRDNETFRAKNSGTIKHWWEIEGKVKINNSKEIEV